MNSHSLSKQLLALAVSLIVALTACQPPELNQRLDETAPLRDEALGGPVDYRHGALEEPVSVFEDVPALTNLDSDLLDALHAAAEAAEREGIPFVVTSGWRSEAYQQQLLDEAIETYGSEEEARRWVHSPEQSLHVTGEAVDIGWTDAADWLGRHGHRWGLCAPYANEMWHFELLTEPGGTCPPRVPDAAAG